MASIIVPAHNEAAVIERTLRSITPDGWPSEYEIIVACNGCTDDTAARARAFEGVKVLETDVGSKVVALNMGDSAASQYPRIYLDADIETDIESIRNVIRVLEAGEADVAAPAAVLETSDCSFLARRYFDVWSRTDYFKNSIGSGFVGMSKAGRERFQEWPNIIPDDEYARLVVPRERRRIVREGRFTIRPPTQLRSLVNTRTRHVMGNYQLKALYPDLWATKEPASSVVTASLKHPESLPWLGLYLGVGLVSRWRARARIRAGELGWYTDKTARTPTQEDDDWTSGD